MSRERKKRLKVASEGEGATLEQNPKKNCMMCDMPMSEVRSCPKCLCGRYCSDKCMKDHENHVQYCSMICDLEKLENKKRIS